MQHVFRVFFEAGPDVSYAYHLGRPPSSTPWLVTYAQLMSLTNENGVAMAFLANDGNYAWIRDLERRNMIVPVVGDFGGPTALGSIGEYLRRRHATVTAFYVSNVEQYLFTGLGANERFYKSVQSLPIDSTSMFIRSLPGPPSLAPASPPTVASTSAFLTGTASIHEALVAFAAGRLSTYAQVLAGTKIDGWR
jgi:hypothetical protein